MRTTLVMKVSKTQKRFNALNWNKDVRLAFDGKGLNPSFMSDREREWPRIETGYVSKRKTEAKLLKQLNTGS